MFDRYTKAVLTVIAAALVAIVAQNAISPLKAQGEAPPQKVQMCDAGGNCARLHYHASRGTEPSHYSLATANTVESIQRVVVCDARDFLQCASLFEYQQSPNKYGFVTSR
jgi:hypothetical protein